MKTTIIDVNPKIVAEWLSSGEAILIDVREKGEFDTSRIKGAINLPLSEVSLKHKQMPQHFGKHIVIQCASGRRSRMACEKLLEEGLEADVWNLEGGITNWSGQGLPVVSGGKSVLPIERQMQLTVGLLILFFIVLGITIDARLAYLTIIPAGGLIVAGLTGWCGMIKLLSKMPWNK
jgi:rhodanese-related sulfurtransferase